MHDIDRIYTLYIYYMYIYYRQVIKGLITIVKIYMKHAAAYS